MSQPSSTADVLPKKEFEHTILSTVKKNLGIGDDYDIFDRDIITAINLALFELEQLFSFADVSTFTVETGEETWSDYLDAANFKAFNTIPAYISLKARLMFDPPTSNFAIEAIERQLARMEFRLTVMDDTKLRILEVEETEKGV